MIEKSLWQQIKDVVDCDKALTAITTNIADLRSGIEKDLQQAQNLTRVLQDKEHQLFTAQKEAQLKELTVKELKASEDHKRIQSDNVTNQKEYKALETEIETLSRKRNVLEEEILKYMYAIDVLKKNIEDLKQSFDEKTTVLARDKQIKEDNIAQLNTKYEETKIHRAQSIAAIPPEWRQQYERMKQSVTDPIVPVSNGSCSACFYSVLHQDLAKLKKAHLVVCRSCYRFLYYDENDSTPGTTTQF